MRPVHSIKHIVDQQGGLTGVTKQEVNIAIAVDAPVLTTSTQIETGSRVNGIFLNVQVLPTALVALANIYMIIYKNAGSNTPITNIPEANQVGTSDFKSKVIHQEMAMVSDVNDSIPITLFKGVIMLPKFMRRMGINDALTVQLFSPASGNEFNFCIQSIYKEFR